MLFIESFHVLSLMENNVRPNRPRRPRCPRFRLSNNDVPSRKGGQRGRWGRQGRELNIGIMVVRIHTCPESASGIELGVFLDYSYGLFKNILHFLKNSHSLEYFCLKHI